MDEKKNKSSSQKYALNYHNTSPIMSAMKNKTVFCRLLFIPPFYFWPLYSRLPISTVRLLMTPLVSSHFSYPALRIPLELYLIKEVIYNFWSIKWLFAYSFDYIDDSSICEKKAFLIFSNTIYGICQPKSNDFLWTSTRGIRWYCSFSSVLQFLKTRLAVLILNY